MDSWISDSLISGIWISGIWITGASDGIGKALAIMFARQKFLAKSQQGNGHKKRLVLSGRNAEKLEQTKIECLKYCEDENDIIIEQFDCEDIKQTIQIAKKIADYIDLAIFCAGVSQRSYSFDMDSTSDETIYKVNFLSPVESSKCLIKHWKTSKHPSPKKIIYISSIAAHIPTPLRAMYGTSKRALEYYCTISRNELKKECMPYIQQSIVIPGFVCTDISKKALVGNNRLWGKMDFNQRHGITTTHAAKKIAKIITKNQKNIYIGMNMSLYIMIGIMKIAPRLGNYIVSKVNTTK